MNQVHSTWIGCEHPGSPPPSFSAAWRTRPAVWMCCKPDERRAFTPCSSAQSIVFEMGQELQKKNSLKVPLPLERGLVEQLLLIADQLLRLVAHLASFALATICTTRRVVDTAFQDYLPPIQFSILVPLCHLCVPLVHTPNNHLSRSLRSSWDHCESRSRV